MKLMESAADSLAKQSDWNIAEFITHFGYFLEKYRGPSLEESMNIIVGSMDAHGKMFIQELYRKTRIGGVL